MHRTLSALSLCALVCSLSSLGCLNPLASDELDPGRLVLPAGSVVESAHDNYVINAQIDAHDGVGAVIPLISGFSNGAPIKYWDFGETEAFAVPLFFLAKDVVYEKDAEGKVIEGKIASFGMVNHNSIIDSIPGDSGYSPFWVVYLLEVTDKYDGELITSFAAIEEAQRQGLIHAPMETQIAVNCPIVAKGTVLEVGGGKPNLAPPSQFFWQGKTVDYFELPQIPLDENIAIPEEVVYVLKREGEEPLSEPLRHVDINGDGDTFDTNNIFSAVKDADDLFTPLARTIEVTVQSTYKSIDTSVDGLTADAMSEVQLFSPEPQSIIVSFQEEPVMRNLPRQEVVGEF